MKCKVLVAEKSVMVSECGGVHLKAGDELTVKPEYANKILNSTSDIKCVKEVEKDSLRSGHYEHKNYVKLEQKAPGIMGEQNKSLEGKGVVKTKG